MSHFIVSICMITYNHSSFIEDAINSILMQKVNFPLQLVISDDCSTDNTFQICKKYQKEYPQLIKLISSDKNIGMSSNLLKAIGECKGKYIAFCEGDDYWVNTLKLQKQVDFLESNSDFSLCSGNYVIEDDLHKSKSKAVIESIRLRNETGCRFELADLQKEWLTKTLTVIFRRDFLDINILSQYKYMRDNHIIYHLLKCGPGFIFSDILGVYRVHSGGVWSPLKMKDASLISYLVFEELYYFNKDSYTLYTYFNSLTNLMSYSDWKEKRSLYRHGKELALNNKQKIILFSHLFPQKIIFLLKQIKQKFRK